MHGCTNNVELNALCFTGKRHRRNVAVNASVSCRISQCTGRISNYRSIEPVAYRSAQCGTKSSTDHSILLTVQLACICCSTWYNYLNYSVFNTSAHASVWTFPMAVVRAYTLHSICKNYIQIFTRAKLQTERSL